MLKDIGSLFVTINPFFIGGFVLVNGFLIVSTYLAFQRRSRTLKLPAYFNQQTTIIDEEEGIRVSSAIDGSTKNGESITTVFDMFRQSRGNPRCLGYCPNEHSEYEWLTYDQVYQRAHQLASALINRLNSSSGNNINISIYAVTSVEWMIADIAIQMNNNVSVPLYKTMGIEDFQYVLNQTECRLVFCGSNCQAQCLINQHAELSFLRTIILFEPCSTGTLEKLRQMNSTLSVEYFYDLIENSGPLIEITLPTGEDIFTLCYTSGTTGLPKGCILTHSAFSTNVCKVYSHLNLPSYGISGFHAGDIFFSFLPLSHSLGRSIQYIMLSLAIPIGIFRGDMNNLLADIALLRPTLFCAVPRILDRLYDGCMERVNRNFILSFFMRWAIRSKMHDFRRGVLRQNTIWDYMFFNRIRNVLGGCLRFVSVGSAPLSEAVLDFSRAAFSCVVVEGYGQTECCGCATLNLPGEHIACHVGAPIPSVQIKLVDVADLNIDWRRDGCGEVCLRGPILFKGYYKLPEKTKEVLDDDGWLHTGDVGMWTDRGCLKIVDRCKNLFKLSQGEYLSPDKIEMILQACPSVSEIFIDGNSCKNYCVAIVVPDFAKIFPDISLTDVNGLKKICEDVDGALRKAIIKECDKIGRSGRLCGFEIPKNVYLHHSSIKSNEKFLTPTMKIKRGAVRRHFKQAVDAMYSE